LSCHCPYGHLNLCDIFHTARSTLDGNYVVGYCTHAYHGQGHDPGGGVNCKCMEYPVIYACSRCISRIRLLTTRLVTKHTCFSSTVILLKNKAYFPNESNNSYLHINDHSSATYIVASAYSNNYVNKPMQYFNNMCCYLLSSKCLLYICHNSAQRAQEDREEDLSIYDYHNYTKLIILRI
jgi:hypothetical protein